MIQEGGMMAGMINMMSGSYGSGYVFLGSFNYILFVALIISAIYWLIKTANRKR